MRWWAAHNQHPCVFVHLLQAKILFTQGMQAEQDGDLYGGNRMSYLHVHCYFDCSFVSSVFHQIAFISLC